MAAEPTIRRVRTNGITLSVAEAGPTGGPPVILLHGFPEPWSRWRRQIGPLAEAGYRVLAPDQRGYGPSDKPRGVAAYRLDELVADLLGLIDDLGVAKATVVGHDWGGVVAWSAISEHPGRFDRAVILNAPHPLAMLREVRGNPRQLLKSWYTLAFQVPKLPEALLRRHDFRALTRTLESSSRAGTFSPEVLAEYKQAWDEPGALAAMIHWYRAAFRDRSNPPPDSIVKVPTLILWGVQDAFLGVGVARTSFALCRSARIEWFDEASHWIHQEEPDRVNRSILGFLAEGAVAPRPA